MIVHTLCLTHRITTTNPSLPPAPQFKSKQAFVPQSVLDAEAVAAICKEYRIHNADVHLRCDASVDQVRRCRLID